jgi:hypothetical protein
MNAQERLDTLTAATAASKSQAEVQLAAPTQDRDAAAARLRGAQASYQTVQDKLNNLRNQHRQDLLHLASLEDKVTSLNAVLDDRDKRVNADEQYLAWRGFMESAFCHIAHATRWSSMTPGSNGDLPTSSHWTVKAALGISVRVPSLTGR